MAKTKWNSFKCNLCGTDSNTNVKMYGYSIINGRRVKNNVGSSNIHVCEHCIKELSKV